MVSKLLTKKQKAEILKVRGGKKMLREYEASQLQIELLEAMEHLHNHLEVYDMRISLLEAMIDSEDMERRSKDIKEYRFYN